MHLLHVASSLDPAHGGVAEGLRQLVAAGAGGPHRHAIVTLDSPDEPYLAKVPAPVRALGPVRSRYGYTPRLVRWLSDNARGFDAVIVHGLWQYHGLATWRSLRGSSVPYFVFCHGMLDPWFRRAYPLKHLKKWLYWPWAEYRVLRDATAVLFTCEEESRLAPQSFGLYRARHAVVGLGVAIAEADRTVSPEIFLEAFPETRDRRRLLFMARIHPKKGCDLLIDAFARVAPGQSQLQLVIAGPDSTGWRAELEARAAALGVSDRITWCGMLSGPMKWSALRAAEAFVLPSHQENFGIAVVEALALGVPVLISKQVNIWSEIVGDGAAIAAADDAAGTLSLLERWLAMPDGDRQAMSRSATACFASRFHVDAAASRLLDCIGRHVGTGRDADVASVDSQRCNKAFPH